MQDVINEISENKIKVKKVKKKQEISEKSYIKPIIFEEKSKNPNISIFELSNKLGVSKELIETILKEIELEKIEESKKRNEELKPKKPSKIKKTIEKIKKSSKGKIDNEDKEVIKDILLRIIFFGIPLNFALFIIFGIKFGWYTWVGWGYAFWFVKKEITSLLRSLWFK